MSTSSLAIHYDKKLYNDQYYFWYSFFNLIYLCWKYVNINTYKIKSWKYGRMSTWRLIWQTAGLFISDDAELSSWHLIWLLASCYRAEAVWIEAFQVSVLFWVCFFLISEKLQLVVLVCLRTNSTSSAWPSREDHKPPQPILLALPALPSPAREKWSPPQVLVLWSRGYQLELQPSGR